MAELFHEAGLPAGVFNVIPGDKEAVDALLTHSDVRAVSFVGSTPVAKYIYETAARHGKRVQALGGAKNHAIVMPDADLDFAADALTGAAYGSAGERCMAISRSWPWARPAIAGSKLRGRREIKGRAGRTGRHRHGSGWRIVGEVIDSGVTEGAKLVLDERGLRFGREQGFISRLTLFDRSPPTRHLKRGNLWAGADRVARQHAR
jgi:malonate-semialdehyde dehydrogenase (acetylating)/methylmalonate-semialdehyde dehydrogenase